MNLIISFRKIIHQSKIPYRLIQTTAYLDKHICIITYCRQTVPYYNSLGHILVTSMRRYVKITKNIEKSFFLVEIYI